MVSLFVIKSKNNVIEKNDKILWNIKEEKQFNDLTTNNTVIMDNKTFESIGRPLPNRLNLVISNTHKYKGKNIITVHSLEQALYIATDKAFIIGGAKLFKEALSLADAMYITEINLDIKDGDVFFPEFNEEDFQKELSEENEKYKRYVYTRKKN